MEHVRQCLPDVAVERWTSMANRLHADLQAREQHIPAARRRPHCTNQVLLWTAGTSISLCSAHRASPCRRRLHRADLTARRGADAHSRSARGFSSGRCSTTPCCNSTGPWLPVLEALAARGIVGGYDLTPHYPALGNALLVCATETRHYGRHRHLRRTLVRCSTRRRPPERRRACHERKADFEHSAPQERHRPFPVSTPPPAP